MKISQQLRAAIKSSGQTISHISEQTGVPVATLSRFLSEAPEQHRDIRLEKTADRLAAYLGLELRLELRPEHKAKAKKKK